MHDPQTNCIVHNTRNGETMSYKTASAFYYSICTIVQFLLAYSYYNDYDNVYVVFSSIKFNFLLLTIAGILSNRLFQDSTGNA